MSEYFKPWRRKFGIVTLLMACVAMGGSVRSRFIGDFIAFSTGCYPMITINSRVGTIEFAWYRECPFKGKPQWSASPIRSGIGNTSAKDSLVYAWGIAEITTAGRVIAQGTSLTLHFWSITIPLTLISVWLLLLSKPRQSTQKKIPEPITDEGT